MREGPTGPAGPTGKVWVKLSDISVFFLPTITIRQIDVHGS